MTLARKHGSLSYGKFGICAGTRRPRQPFADYCIGLLSAEGRKSVEPLAAVTAPERTVAQHQSLLQFVAQAPWSDQAMLRRMREAVLPSDLIGRGLGRSHPSLLTVRAGARARDASPRPV